MLCIHSHENADKPTERTGENKTIIPELFECFAMILVHIVENMYVEIEDEYASAL